MQNGSMQLDCAQGPEILAGSTSEDDFRSVELTSHFTPQVEVKICEHNVAIFSNKNVFRFQIAVNNSEHVQVLQSKKDFSNIKPA